MTPSLRSNIRLMQEELRNKISDLNSGGCIHFAYYFSLRLKELEVPHQLSLFHYKKIDTTYRTFRPVAHVTVYIPDIGYVDGYKTTSYNSYDFNRKVKLDPYYLKFYPGWNSTYKKSQNVKLKKVINKFIQ